MKKVNSKTSKTSKTIAGVNSFCIFGEVLFPKYTPWFKHLGSYDDDNDNNLGLVAFKTVFDMFLKRMQQHEQTRNNNLKNNSEDEKLFSFNDIVEVAVVAYALGGLVGECNEETGVPSEISRIKTKFDQLDAEIKKAEKEAAEKKAMNAVKIIEGKSADEILVKITDEIRVALENVSVN